MRVTVRYYKNTGCRLLNNMRIGGEKAHVNRLLASLFTKNVRRHIMKKFLLMLVVLMISSSLSGLDGQNVSAEGQEIQVYYEGERLVFEDTDPILIDNRTMVPFRKIFETLGFEVEWVDGQVRKAIGRKQGSTIELTIDSDEALVNDKIVKLDVPAQIHKDKTLVPLRFVSENSGFHVYFEDQAGTFIVGIGATEESADPRINVPSQPKPPVATERIEPFVIKGQVADNQGNSIAGVEVYAYNTFVSSSYIGAVTDEEGKYRIELPQITTTYTMYAIHEVQYNGQQFTVNPVAEDESIIAGRDGAIRNLVWNINVGKLGVYSSDYMYPHDEDAPEVEYEDIELTLEPVGKLLDGSTGVTIVDRVTNLEKDVPVGVYKITAVWKPKGYPPVKMLVRSGGDNPAESATLGFDERNYLPFDVLFP